jgi:hypothetical protein
MEKGMAGRSESGLRKPSQSRVVMPFLQTEPEQLRGQEARITLDRVNLIISLPRIQ